MQPVDPVLLKVMYYVASSHKKILPATGLHTNHINLIVKLTLSLPLLTAILIYLNFSTT